MVCLAWLLLALVPVHGASMPMPAADGGAGMTMAGSSAACAMDSAFASAPKHAGDCCSAADDLRSMPGCHCAATCSTALASALTLVLLPVMPHRAGEQPRKDVAPDRAHPPLLRPPAA
jgi:hypothetical protein